MPFKFGRASRILKPSEYRLVFNNSKMTQGKYWQIKARQISTQQPRLGLAISKKVCRLAVERNLYKRIAREVFRTQQNALQNWEFVIMAKHLKTQNRAAMAQDLLDLLQKTTQNA